MSCRKSHVNLPSCHYRMFRVLCTHTHKKGYYYCPFPPMKPRIETGMLNISLHHVLITFLTTEQPYFVARQCNTHIANNSMHCSEGVFGDSIKEFLPPHSSYLNPCHHYLCGMLKDKKYSYNSCTEDMKKQDKQCMYNVTLRCVHATIVAVEK